jgi:predicted Zn-dependent protease
LHELADPVFAAAGLVPRDVDIFIVRDDQLNAFVAGGQNLFLNTGLISRAKTPEQLLGVIAHETGHIAGGHLSRANTALNRAGTEMIIGSLLGLAAAVAGAPELGTAVIAGGLTFAERNLLAFSRAQEQSADQAAVTYLERLSLPPSGLLEFFDVMEQSSLGLDRGGTAFMRTHPLTRDRVLFIQQRAASSPYRGRELPADIHELFARSIAKLDAFSNEPATTLRQYGGDRVVDRYAQAIAYYRRPDLQRALDIIHGLIREEPANPHFRELEGQMLFENGRTAAAIAPYREAVRLDPTSSMFHFGLARALLEQPGQEAAAEAARELREVVAREPDNASAWRFLGIAEGKAGRQGPSALAFTEAAVLRRDRDDARLWYARAQAAISPADPNWLRLQDLDPVVDDLRDSGRGR